MDFISKDIIGQAPPRVIRATLRCLNTRIPRVANEYVRILEEKVLRHQLIERMGAVHSSSKSHEKMTKRINRIDRELGQYMRHAEKKCRKIKSGRIPFLPEACGWIKRTQVYRLLLKYHEGRIRNRGNLKRSAWRCGIVDAMSILHEEINARLNVCIKQCNHFCKHGMSYRRKHLQRRLTAAREKEDNEAERQILSIIQQEKDKFFWQRINYVLGKPRGGSCFKVQVEQENRTLKEHSTQGGTPECYLDKYP